jgi:uncharacterized membrane protein SpoIIM required for sporulation
MKVAQLLESRRENWRLLEQLCNRMENRGKRSLRPAEMTRFASLYRATCADLALADGYQLPEQTVHYLHQLVGRAHNQLYRSRLFDLRGWLRELLHDVPRRLFHDGYFRLALALFWGGFLLSAFLASGYSPLADFAVAVVGEEGIFNIEQMYNTPIGDQPVTGAMAGYYILNNTSIGLQCFAMGMLFGVGGLFATLFNAIFLGTIFGHMSKVPQAANFFNFVTAHGPFELTAIVLSAAAGMRLGFALVDTRGMTRSAALRRAGNEAMPIMGAAIVLFGLAALIEAFISPSALPYTIKAGVSIVSAVILLFYFLVLGTRGNEPSAT